MKAQLELVSLIVEDYTRRSGSLFLRVDDFDAMLAKLRAANVEIASPPRSEPYGRICVFRDLAGNRWDCSVPGSVLRSPRTLDRGACKRATRRASAMVAEWRNHRSWTRRPGSSSATSSSRRRSG